MATRGFARRQPAPAGAGEHKRRLQLRITAPAGLDGAFRRTSDLCGTLLRDTLPPVALFRPKIPHKNLTGNTFSEVLQSRGSMWEVP